MTVMQADQTLALVKKSLEDMKAVDVRVLDVEALTTITSQMVVCTGTSKRHVQSISENLITEAKHANQRPIGVEGSDQGEWVLVDMGDVVVHIMQAQARALYQLEKLWAPSPEDISTSDQAR